MSGSYAFFRQSLPPHPCTSRPTFQPRTRSEQEHLSTTAKLEDALVKLMEHPFILAPQATYSQIYQPPPSKGHYSHQTSNSFGILRQPRRDLPSTISQPPPPQERGTLRSCRSRENGHALTTSMDNRPRNTIPLNQKFTVMIDDLRLTTEMTETTLEVCTKCAGTHGVTSYQLLSPLC